VSRRALDMWKSVVAFVQTTMAFNSRTTVVRRRRDSFRSVYTDGYRSFRILDVSGFSRRVRNIGARNY